MFWWACGHGWVYMSMHVHEHAHVCEHTHGGVCVHRLSMLFGTQAQGEGAVE